VEVARSLLIKEIAGVFQAYNIKVNRRHLDLVADYMSFEGDVKPFNRIGIASSPSPLLKMSFETTMQFMTDACA
jgi:DNA-directed RNA polymerase I subunit RPA1